MTTPVEVLAIEPVNRASHKATAAVRVGAFVIYGIKLIEDRADSFYLALPQAPSRQNGAGWRAVLDVTSPRLLDQMRDAVLAAWRSANDALTHDLSEGGAQERVPLPKRGRRAWS